MTDEFPRRPGLGELPEEQAMRQELLAQAKQLLADEARVLETKHIKAFLRRCSTRANANGAGR